MPNIKSINLYSFIVLALALATIYLTSANLFEKDNIKKLGPGILAVSVLGAIFAVIGAFQWGLIVPEELVKKLTPVVSTTVLVTIASIIKREDYNQASVKIIQVPLFALGFMTLGTAWRFAFYR